MGRGYSSAPAQLLTMAEGSVRQEEAPTPAETGDSRPDASLLSPDTTAPSPLHRGSLAHHRSPAEAVRQATRPQEAALGIPTARAASLLACMGLVADPARAMAQAAERRQSQRPAADRSGTQPIAGQPADIVAAIEVARSYDGAELLLLARTPVWTRSAGPEGCWGTTGPSALDSDSESSDEDATDAVGSAAREHRLRVMAWAKTMQGAVRAEEGGGSHRAAAFSPGRHRRRRVRLDAALAASAERARVRSTAAASATTFITGEGCEAAAASSSLDPASLQRLELPDPGRIRDATRLKPGGLSRSISDNSAAMRGSLRDGHDMASMESDGWLSETCNGIEQVPCNSTAGVPRRALGSVEEKGAAAGAGRYVLNNLAASGCWRAAPLSSGSRARERSDGCMPAAAAATKPPQGPRRSDGSEMPRGAPASGAAPASGSWWGLGSALWQLASAVQRRASERQQQQQSSGSHLVSVWQQQGAHSRDSSRKRGAG